MSTNSSSRSCGVLIVNEANELLVCKVALSKSRWDIPKGGLNEGESFRQCAIRECLEETGFDVSSWTLEALGETKYISGKNLFLFKARTLKSNLDLSSFNCSSFFDYTPRGSMTSRKVPEVVAVKWQSIDLLSEDLSANMVKAISPFLKK